MNLHLVGFGVDDGKQGAADGPGVGRGRGWPAGPCPSSCGDRVSGWPSHFSSSKCVPLGSNFLYVIIFKYLAVLHSLTQLFTWGINN